MTLKAWGFEGQTNGVNIDVATSDDFGDAAFSLVSQGVSGFLKYSTAQARYGTVSALWNVTTTTTATIAEASDTSANQAAAHTWIYITSSPTAEIQGPVTFRGSSAAQARLQLSATNQLRCVIVTGGAGTLSTGTIPNNTWCLIETVLTGATGVASAATMTANVYDVNGALLFSVPTTSGGTAAAIDAVRWGKAGGTSNVSYHLDDMRQDIGRGTEIEVPLVTTTLGLPTADSFSAAGFVGQSAPLSTTDGFTASGFVGLSAPLTTTDALTAAGVVGVTTTAPLSTTDGLTGTGRIGVLTTAPLATTDGFTAAGTVASAAGSAPLVTTDALVATGRIGVLTTAPLATSDALVSTGRIGVLTTAPLATSDLFVAAGAVGAAITGDAPMATLDLFTAAGFVGTSTATTGFAVSGSSRTEPFVGQGVSRTEPYVGQGSVTGLWVSK